MLSPVSRPWGYQALRGFPPDHRRAIDTGLPRGHEIPGGCAEVDDDGVRVGCCADWVFFGLAHQKYRLVYGFSTGARQTLIRL